MPQTRLSFKEMCERFDVTPRTLRYYEYIELLAPDREGRSRWYGARDVARMKLILRGRRFGFSLEEIRQWLELYDQAGTAEQMRVFLNHSDRQLAVLRARQKELAGTIDELQDLRSEAAALLQRQTSKADAS